MKSFLRKLIQKTGYDFKRMPIDPLERQKLKLFKKYGINLVFDIGANAGQYALKLRKVGYRGKIVSFEPLPDVFERLRTKASLDPQWTAVHTALGASSGITQINIAKNSYSSSILEMLPTHVESAPHSVYFGKIDIPMQTVDDCIDQYYRPDSRLFIKVDTQGFEKKVFEGCLGSLEKISGFQMELSRIPLYEGETLFYEMVELLDQYSYKLMLLENGFCKPETGELLQMDGFFFRTD